MSPDVAPAPRGLAAVALGAVLGAVAIAWIVVFTGVANGTTVPVADTAQILTASTAAVLLCWRAKVDPSRRPTWIILAGATVIWALADLVWMLSSARARHPFPDGLNLVYAGCAIAYGTACAIAARRPGSKLHVARTALDGLLFGTVVVMLGWAIFWSPDVGERPGSVAMALVGADAFFLAMATLAWSRSDTRHRWAFGLVMAGSLVLVTTDITYLREVYVMAHDNGRVLDLGWSLVSLSFIAAALHPGSRQRPEKSDAVQAIALEQFVPIFMVLVIFGAVTIPGHLTGSQDEPGRIVAWAVLVILMARQVLALREARVLTRRLEEGAVELARQADTDELTGLAERRVLVAAAAAALATRARAGGRLALLSVDLDGFKRINDRLGHGVGDEVLRQVARRLRSVTADGDVVARFGGDEFVILRPDAGEDVEEWAERVRLVLAEPVLADQLQLRLTSSIGLVLADGTETDTDVDRLLADADLALYRAKHEGRNRVEQFSTALRSRATDASRLAGQLERAVEDGGLVVHYQPIIDLATEAIVGAEALVRWDHPELGLLAPSSFMPLAETVGITDDIAQHVLATALRDFGSASAVDPTWWVTANLGPVGAFDPLLADRLADLLAEHGLPAERLVLEVAEQTVPDPVVRHALDHLASMGVGLALDDFGSGWSTFSQLRTLPVRWVKLDRDLVTLPGRDGTRPSALLTAMVALAEELQLGVVAEGIETEEQADGARAAGCGHGQGFLWGEPMPIADLLALAPAPTRDADAPAPAPEPASA